MSTKSTIYLTEDNEHGYYEMLNPAYKNNRYIGNSIIIEFKKKNIKILDNDDEDLEIEIYPGSEIYEIVKKMIN